MAMIFTGRYVSLNTLMNIVFFASIVLYFVSSVLLFSGSVFKKQTLLKLAWIGTLTGFAVHTAYAVMRGVVAGRIPMSNQFEFAMMMAWGCVLLGVILRVRLKADWILSIAVPIAFIVQSYAALQPRDINELMPALRSAWFALHIGTAVFSYASFALAGCIGVKYLVSAKKGGETAASEHLDQLDRLAYKLIAFGFLMLTIVILSGCVWAEQAWSTFWSWDPKETWALITWIIYAIFLHQRLRKSWRGKRMAWFAIIAFICVLFTFAGVNTLLPGLHAYA